jgi:hypothetical protein
MSDLNFGGGIMINNEYSSRRLLVRKKRKDRWPK